MRDQWVGEAVDRDPQTCSVWYSWRSALALSALLCIPYLLVLRNFFYTDDWVHLQYNGLIPPWQVWRYFSPQVIWFYRPIQALQFGWLFHTAGFRPLAYNLCLLLMHIAVCMLVYLLVKRLSTPHLALLTTGLFAAHWRCSNMLLWQSNFSTLHWSIATLGLCLLFLNYLEHRRPTVLIAASLLFIIDLVAKETAVTSPLLLIALWWRYGSSSAASGPSRNRLRDGVCVLGPFLLLTAAYVGFHAHVVRDVYLGYVRPHYCFASPAAALSQTLSSFNSALLSFDRDPVLLPQLPLLQSAVGYVVKHGLILPCAVVAAAWRRRDWLLGFGAIWTLTTLVPTAWLTVYYMDRFFYLPVVGTSLITARALQCYWHGVRGETGRPRVPRTVAPLCLGYLLTANLATVMLLCLSSRDDARVLAATFKTLQNSAHLLPRGSLIVLKNVPERYFGSGFGVAEMVRLGLGDSTAQGIIDHQPLSGWWLEQMRRYPSVFAMDFDQHPFVLRQVASTGRAGNRSASADDRPSRSGAALTGKKPLIPTSISLRPPVDRGDSQAHRRTVRYSRLARWTKLPLPEMPRRQKR
jgi:hypothetical protein